MKELEEIKISLKECQECHKKIIQLKEMNKTDQDLKMEIE